VSRLSDPSFDASPLGLKNCQLRFMLSTVRFCGMLDNGATLPLIVGCGVPASADMDGKRFVNTRPEADRALASMKSLREIDILFLSELSTPASLFCAAPLFDLI
jgi:hypothetical protein